MVLQPLEFSECYLDSPWFRQSIHEYEGELERTNTQIKQLIKDAKNWLNASRTQGKMMHVFSTRLHNFQFDIIGEKLTDDEKGIADSLKEFGEMLTELEGEWTRTIERAEIQLVQPLENFRKEHIRAYRESKKIFDKSSERYYKQMDHTLGLSYKKKEQLQQESDNDLLLQKRNFHRASLGYVYKLQEVQERKKFEFVEHLLMFMQVYFNYFHQCHETAFDCGEYMKDLQLRLVSTRGQYEGTQNKTESLMRKMAEYPEDSNRLSPVRVIGQRWAGAGYLLLQDKNAISSRLTKWNRYFCMYTKENKLFQMMPQFSSSMNSSVGSRQDGSTAGIEPMIVLSCVGRNNDTIDKRFCFDISVEESSSGKQVTLTLQGTSASDKNKWLRVMDGKEPEESKPKDYRKQEEPFDLNETSIKFVENVIAAIERRGLEAEGIYRLVGVSSKVDKILQIVLDKERAESFDYDDELDWELNTLTSALKSFFRNLPEPIMTFDFHRDFIEAAKHENPEERLKKVTTLVNKLHKDSHHILKVLIRHLRKVTSFSDENKMVPQNLGVCFGPTLMRPKEETVASIMEIKFNNIIVEILIENYTAIFEDMNDGSVIGKKEEDILTRKRREMGRLPSQRFKSRPRGLYENSALNLSSEVNDVSSTIEKFEDQSMDLSRLSPATAKIEREKRRDSRFVRGQAFRGVPGKPLSPNTRMKFTKLNAPLADIEDETTSEEEDDEFGSMTKLDLDIHLDGITSITHARGIAGDAPTIIEKDQEGKESTYVNLQPKTQPLNPAPNDRVNKEKWEVKERNGPGSGERSPDPLPRKHRGSSLKSLNRNSSDSDKPISPQPVARSNNTRRSISDSRKAKSVVSRWQHNENNNNNHGGTSLVESAKGKLLASFRSSQHAFSGKSYKKKTRPSLRKKPPPAVKPKPKTRPQSYHPTNHNTDSSPKPLRAYSDKTKPVPQRRTSEEHPPRSFLWPKPGSIRPDSYIEPIGKPEAISRSSAVITRQNTAAVKAIKRSSSEGARRKKDKEEVEDKENDSESEIFEEDEDEESASRSSDTDLESDSECNMVAKTLYACQGEHDNELSFQPGQLIFNVRQSSEPGWLIGSMNGRTGLIPENYVNFLE